MNTYNIIGSMFGALLIALPISADNTQQAYKNLKIQNKTSVRDNELYLKAL